MNLLDLKLIFLLSVGFYATDVLAIDRLHKVPQSSKNIYGQNLRSEAFQDDRIYGADGQKLQHNYFKSGPNKQRENRDTSNFPPGNVGGSGAYSREEEGVAAPMDLNSEIERF